MEYHQATGLHSTCKFSSNVQALQHMYVCMYVCMYIFIYIYKDPDRGESHWQELHPQLFVRPWWRARSMLGVTSRPINAGRKKKVPSQFALHPPLCFGKAAELQPLRAWTIQHLVYYRAYDMYPYMHNMYTYVIIV